MDQVIEMQVEEMSVTVEKYIDRAKITRMLLLVCMVALLWLLMAINVPTVAAQEVTPAPDASGGAQGFWEALGFGIADTGTPQEEGKSSVKGYLSEYGAEASNIAEWGFIVVGLVWLGIHMLIGWRNDGLYGLIVGAVVGAFIFSGIYGIWYNLEQGHVIPFLIGIGIGVIGGIFSSKYYGYEIAQAAVIAMAYWVWLGPSFGFTLWDSLNVFYWSGATDWYDLFGLPRV